MDTEKNSNGIVAVSEIGLQMFLRFRGKEKIGKECYSVIPSSNGQMHVLLRGGGTGREREV